MFCPFCGGKETQVTDTRPNLETGAIRRRRKCASCGRRFKTLEAVDSLPLPRVIKHSGVRVDFSRDKLERSVQLALKKRPIPTDDVDNLINRVIKRALQKNAREISSKLLGEWVMEELRALDLVAYVRYASVYWDFKTLDNFTDTIRRLS